MKNWNLDRTTAPHQRDDGRGHVPSGPGHWKWVVEGYSSMTMTQNTQPRQQRSGSRRSTLRSWTPDLHPIENLWREGSRLILPTGRTCATNFLSWSHEHIISCQTSRTLMCCRSEWQERMYIYKWHEVDQTKHEIFCVHIVCNEIQVKVNLEITTFFFYLRFPYCPNFFWFGVVYIY